MIIFIYFILEKYVMVKVVLFDLGDTLEHNDVLREDTIDTLEKIENMENPPILGLASDFGLPNDWGLEPQEEQIERSKQAYFSMLSDLQIKRFFVPQNVTLSTEVGNTKDQNIQKIFPNSSNQNR